MATYSDREPDPAPELYSAALLRRLKISPEVGWYMASRRIPLPESPPQIKTPEPRTVKGAMFDPSRVDRVLRVFHELRHTKGRLAGQPLDPDPWQIAYILAPVFGWVHLDDDGFLVRLINTLYVDVPRKNGKSTLAGGLGIYLTCSDYEAGAEVIAAATTKEQAGFVFNPAKALAEKAPALRTKVKVYAASIQHPGSGSYFKVVSSGAEAQHGGNIHGAIIDELHLHKTPDLVEAIETGTGSRTQPLIVFITTADEGKPNTIYARRRTYVEQLARRVFQDSSTYGVIWHADEKDPIDSPATHAKANPGYPISPSRRYLDNEAKKAKNSPAELANFQRLNLGIRTKQKFRFITLRDWDRNAGVRLDRRAPELEGAEAWGGLDLASVSDLTALCWLLPQMVEFPDGRTLTGYRAYWHAWAPEAALEALDKRTADAASLWVKQGHLVLTPGDVTDYDFVFEQILSDAEFYDVRSLGFDPYNATDLTNRLVAAGIPMVRVRQGPLTLSPALKEVQRLLLIGRRDSPMIEHGGNPLVRWTVDNLAVRFDANQNVAPDKEHSPDKIDPVSALASAMSEALTRDSFTRSAYADSDAGVAFA
jgi:phage terminase large subunit-like protein